MPTPNDTPPQQPPKPPRKRSAGRRFLTVGALTLLMFIPIFFAAEVVRDRKAYSQDAIDTVSRDWGGAQLLSGPQLVIPVTETVTRWSHRPRVDPKTGLVMRDPETDEELSERISVTVIERRDPVYLYPDQFDLRIVTETQERQRGIFRVPVYNARLTAEFTFAPDSARRALQGKEQLNWQAAELRVGVTSNRALRGVARLRSDDQDLALEPMSDRPGITAEIGDPRGQGAYTLELGMNGAQRFHVVPVGRESHITMQSDWPHPAFGGAFLPDQSTISDSGFEAQWRIPHLARSLSQISRSNPEADARRKIGFGVSYHTPNDFYQKAFRAARYGILFIALTFLTILLMERSAGPSARQAHPVQYILAGLAQTSFVLLMVSYAEHIGFAAAYALASAAVIGLLTVFGLTALRLGARAFVLGGVLLLVYAVLYLILQSADYALLAGSTLAFLALALTMLLTRNEDWYGAVAPQSPAPKGKAKTGRALNRLFGNSTETQSDQPKQTGQDDAQP